MIDAISTALPLISDRLTNLELILDPTYLSPFLANTASYTSLVDLSVVYESNDLWDLEAEFDSDAAELERLSSPHMSNLITELSKLDCKLGSLEVGIWNLEAWVLPTLRAMLAVPACRNLSKLAISHGAVALSRSAEFEEFARESRRKGLNIVSCE